MTKLPKEQRDFLNELKTRRSAEPLRAKRRLDPCEDVGCRFCTGGTCHFGLLDCGCPRQEGPAGDTTRDLMAATIRATQEGRP